MSKLTKITSLFLVGLLLGFTEFSGVLPDFSGLRAIYGGPVNKTSAVNKNIFKSDPYFREIGLLRTVTSPDVRALSLDIAANQSAGYSEIANIRGLASKNMYVYQLNGYIAEPMWSEDAQILLDFASASSDSGDALKVTLRNVAARCGIPVVTPFMVSQAQFSWEYIMLQVFMMKTKLSAQQLFESATYSDDIVGSLMNPCSHFRPELFYQAEDL